MTPLFSIMGPAGLSWSPGLAVLMGLLLLCAALILTIIRALKRLSGAPGVTRFFVVALNIVAFCAVALLLAPPERLQEQSDEVLLLTTGTDTSDLPLNRRVYALPGVEIRAGQDHVQALSLPGQLSLREPGLTTLEVRGHGLSWQEWQQLPADLRVRFEPPPLAGPTDVQWPRLLQLGEPLSVTGRLSLPEENRVARLVLMDPAGLPVAETTARSGQAFAVQSVPRASGRMSYTLQSWLGDTLLSEDPVSTFVQANRGARLLVVQSAPSFDTRQLVNWAADRGQEVVVLTRISQDRDLAQGFNTPDALQLSLNKEMLSWADLLIMDGRRWSTLGAAQASLVLEAVSGGAGLLLLADRQLAEWLPGPANESLDFALRPAEPGLAAWPVWPGGAPATPLPLAPWRLDNAHTGTTAQTLTASEEGVVLEAWQALGAGRVAISLIRERQRWFTEGQAVQATRYWSYLMRTLARPVPAPEWLAPASREMVRVNRVFDFCIAGTGPADYQLEVPAGDMVFEGELVTHADGFPVACGRARAQQAGWHVLKLQTGEAGEGPSAIRGLPVQVFAEQDWLASDNALRQAATRARATGSALMEDDVTVMVRSEAFSPWWPFLVLLFAGSLLWLERRLFDLK